MNICKFLVSFIVFCFSSIIAQQQINIEWPTLGNSPWPMIKHDPQFTGRSPYKGPQTPTIVWTADMPDGIFSGPVISEYGNLYFGSYYQLDSADYFYSYSPDGNLMWDYRLGTNRPPQSGILIDSSNTVYFGSLDKYFYALNSDGTLKWKYETSAPIVEIAIPNIDLNGKLYITNGLGELYSINPDGTLNWNIKYESGFYGKSPVFSPDGNTIYVFGIDSNLFALNLNGNIQWKFSCGNANKAPAIDNNGNLYFLPEEIPQKIYSLDSCGTIRWQTTIIDSSFIPSYSSPTIDSLGNIYVALGSAILSYDYSGIFRWMYIIGNDPSEYDEFWQPLICDKDGTIYVGSTFGIFYYAITSNGELKWKLPLNDYQVDNTSAIGEDGTLFLGVHKSSLTPNQQRTLLAIRDTNVTGIIDNTISINHNLKQNYPNPFNSSTTIQYSIYREANVRLEVYNLLGQKLKTIVNENKRVGNYEVEFNAENLPSGVYFYRIQTENKILSKKMLLLR